MSCESPCYDIDDFAWAVIASRLPGKKNDRGGTAKDNRLFINAVIWVLRTGAPWRDLPPRYGDWKNTHRRFCRWRDKGVWEELLAVLIEYPGFEWIMLDAAQAGGYRRVCGGEADRDAANRAKRGSRRRFLWPWMRMICRSDELSQTLPWRIAKRFQSA